MASKRQKDRWYLSRIDQKPAPDSIGFRGKWDDLSSMLTFRPVTLNLIYSVGPETETTNVNVDIEVKIMGVRVVMKGRDHVRTIVTINTEGFPLPDHIRHGTYKIVFTANDRDDCVTIPKGMFGKVDKT